MNDYVIRLSKRIPTGNILLCYIYRTDSHEKALSNAEKRVNEEGPDWSIKDVRGVD